jgi:hypothetical protein
MTRVEMDELRARYTQQLLDASKKVREEPQPKGEDIRKHVFAERDVVREPLRPLPSASSPPSRPAGSKNGIH